MSPHRGKVTDVGLLARLLQPRAADPGFSDEWYTTTPGAFSSAGAFVNVDSAMRLSAVWACRRLIADSLASSPLFVYRYMADGGRQRATQHPLFELLHSRPNRLQTSFEFVEQLTGDCLMRGNGYARILPGPRGFADQLVRLPPDDVTPERVGDTVRYQVLQGDGTKSVVNGEDVFHLRGLGDDGLVGLSVIQYARESFGVALAAEGYGARFFSQDARPGGVLKHPNKLTPEAAKRLKESWAAAHGGYGKAHSTAVLEEGVEWQQVGMSSEDAQFLETREFQIADIARWFGCPLHLIQETSKATSWGTGIESLGIAFVTYTLLAWARRWEQAISRDLILAPGSYFAEFLLDGLARGDQGSRYAAYAVGRNWGWLSVNEIRQKENLNPIANGDAYLQPLNMQEVGAPPASAPQPAPATLPSGHYHMLLHEAATRIVRKEIAVMSKAAKRCASDAAEWRIAVAEFYGEHIAFVRETLRISAVGAADYCSEQVQSLIERGAAEMEDWETRRVADLITLALGGTQ
jgi:HK97 family phage portal protein